jgi:hypothetical protein
MVEAPSRQYRCKLRSGSFRNAKNDISNSNKTLEYFELSKELSSTPRKGAALATDLGAERPGFEHLRERMGAAALLNSALCEKERHDFSVYQGRAGGQEGAGRQAGRTERPGHPADCRRSLRLMAQFSSVANIIFCPYPLLSSFHNCSLCESGPTSDKRRLPAANAQAFAFAHTYVRISTPVKKLIFSPENNPQQRLIKRQWHCGVSHHHVFPRSPTPAHLTRLDRSKNGKSSDRLSSANLLRGPKYFRNLRFQRPVRAQHNAIRTQVTP